MVSYLVSGFCYGGVVAFEAVRQLAIQGQDARLILFDVSRPDYPSLFSLWRTKIGNLWNKSRRLSDDDGQNVDTKLFPEADLRARLSHVARQVAWHVMIPLRWLFIPIERVPGVRRFFDWAQRDYFPFYRARPIYAPVLHFLSTGERLGSESESRFGWRRVARRGIDERFLTLDHANVLHESALPQIVGTLREWCGGF